MSFGVRPNYIDRELHVISKIHDHIKELYRKYQIKEVILDLPLNKMQKWSDFTARRLRIDRDDFYSKVSDLFWSVGYVQLAIGYALIAKESCKFPRGLKGTVYKEQDVPILLNIAEVHFWHHIYCTIECIYRSWERMALIIKAACFPENKDKLYFDGIITKIEDDSKFSKNPNLKQLSKQVKHWTKIAEKRNKLSHKESSPMSNVNIDVVFTNIASQKSGYIPKYSYTTKDLVETFKNVRDDYKRLLPAILDVKKFIDSL